MRGHRCVAFGTTIGPAVPHCGAELSEVTPRVDSGSRGTAGPAVGLATSGTTR